MLTPAISRAEAAGGGQRLAGVQQPLEGLPRARPRAGRPEFHEAGPAAGLGARSAVAHGEAVQPLALADEHGLAEPLGLHGADLARQVEARVDRVGQLAAGAEGALALPLRHARCSPTSLPRLADRRPPST